MFRCQQSVSSPASTDPAGQNVVNTAVATGVDPTGTTVTDDADDDVDAFNPAISLTKLVNGAESVTIPSGQQVTYTYAVANEGNTPLQNVALADDTPAVRGPDARHATATVTRSSTSERPGPMSATLPRRPSR